MRVFDCARGMPTECEHLAVAQTLQFACVAQACRHPGRIEGPLLAPGARSVLPGLARRLSKTGAMIAPHTHPGWGWD